MTGLLAPDPHGAWCNLTWDAPGDDGDYVPHGCLQVSDHDGDHHCRCGATFYRTEAT